ncbi:MAG: metal ABC transporter substrate-binding protein [Lachnospiraceae bacterium]|nr:metal ABC transporter substrate-binding protein [Lachnospiraceae bacterium]
MKKYLSILVAAILMAGCLSACGNGSAVTAGNEKLQIVTTIFPEYDWVMNVLGDNPAGAEVTMLLDSGVDLHSYQPTAADILKISTCDLFIYVGGESDEWVEDALREVTNDDQVVINLLEVLGDSVKEEEVVEGMQEEHEHEHDHEEGDHDEDEQEQEHEHEHEDGEIEYDEHVWLSLRNASVLTEKISEAIQSVDPAHANVYKTNTSSYLEKLDALDGEYKNTVAAGSVDTLLFGDRFPFRYLVDDYGLDYYAAFVGCSAETEASFETITYLSGKVDELSLHAIMTIEGTDHRIAETIRQNTQTKDQQILTMDSMQSVVARDVENGASYLSAMEGNLNVLREALQ